MINVLKTAKSTERVRCRYGCLLFLRQFYVDFVIFMLLIIGAGIVFGVNHKYQLWIDTTTVFENSLKMPNLHDTATFVNWVSNDLSSLFEVTPWAANSTPRLLNTTWLCGPLELEQWRFEKSGTCANTLFDVQPPRYAAESGSQGECVGAAKLDPTPWKIDDGVNMTTSSPGKGVCAMLFQLMLIYLLC